ncbi:heat shock protein [Ameyamaea chiangmaiensis NBRC 103196]|uniref:RNA-binding protein n=1 Tax=Ameyamaea chiangmaiensis TaxID=442969 RepID=A0A850P8R6_9PROT|nr:S4 domain-containing protein [Ameyamaea chiangmaiensis]MBS4074354.1 RNA-binding protein [Ameyamaea chiangmaiensis]NVN40298.1 RNA-binding protein [Ameyamaea chiangmaiensis]GBQ71754.1 heat shock protein [Ameyamaea chiangmaiensis NBRC 103196]
MSRRGTPGGDGSSDGDAGEQRIDLWLWHARVARTRALCAAIAESGHVRLNRQRVEKAHMRVRAGDVVTLPSADRRQVRVLEVRAIAPRRGSATEAATLYRVIEEP